MGPFVEPVHLQLVCLRVWDDLGGKTRITAGDVSSMVGKVDTILADYYAEKVARIAADRGVPESRIRRWFETELITKDGLRAKVPRERGTTRGLPNAVIDALRDAYLIRAEEQRRITWFELTHDRLIDPIQQNNDAWFHRRLGWFQRQVVRWARRGQLPKYLAATAASILLVVTALSLYGLIKEREARNYFIEYDTALKWLRETSRQPGAGDAGRADPGVLLHIARGDIKLSTLGDLPQPSYPEVSFNGQPVSRPDRRREADFNVLEIYKNFSSNPDFPLICSDLIGNTYVRITYQKTDPRNPRSSPSASLSSSVQGSPSFRLANGSFLALPRVDAAAIESARDNTVRVRLKGAYGLLADLVADRSYPDGSLEQTRAGLSYRMTVRRDLTLAPAGRGPDGGGAFRMLTVSSMYFNDKLYDCNAIRYRGADGRVGVLRLSGKLRDRPLFERPVEIDGWFELVKEPGSFWSPDSPSIRVDFGRPSSRRLGLQGQLADRDKPNEYSLTVWLEWLDAPEKLAKGTEVGFDFTITATPPREIGGR